MECNTIEGFFILGACFHFEGTTLDGSPVVDCIGKCTNWQTCIEHFPERECDRGRGYYDNSNTSRVEAPTNWFNVIGFILLLLLITCIMFCFGVLLSKNKEKNDKEPDFAHYDKHDALYWDSVLPKESPGDGKYAHLNLNINGEIIIELDEEG